MTSYQTNLYFGLQRARLIEKIQKSHKHSNPNQYNIYIIINKIKQDMGCVILKKHMLLRFDNTF